jgi:hypothetical protein
VTIHLDEVGVLFDDDHDPKIQLDDTYSILMKYPSMDDLMSQSDTDISVEASLGLIANCIDQIYTEEESWAATDSTKEELISWIEDLEPKNFTKLERFFDTMPKLSHTIEVVNPETGVTSEIVLEGLASFFA